VCVHICMYVCVISFYMVEHCNLSQYHAWSDMEHDFYPW
jgi:hypothetical protein